MKAKYKMTVAALAGVALGAVAMMVSGIATAVAQDTVRVRGTIERIDGSLYVIKARDGAELKVTLADNPQIAGVVKRFPTSSRAHSWASLRCRRLTAASAHSKCISFLRPCGEPEKDTTHGIFARRAQ
jgi:hypothetical protein